MILVRPLSTIINQHQQILTSPRICCQRMITQQIVTATIIGLRVDQIKLLVAARRFEGKVITPLGSVIVSFKEAPPEL